jgi:hypothetical protein
MPFIIRQKKNPTVVYANPDDGWVETKPPDPPNPIDKAKRFDDKKAAEEFIRFHGMEAEAVLA